MALDLHGEVKKKYQEALSLVTVAHTSRDTDSTVAMMLFQKAASMYVCMYVCAHVSTVGSGSGGKHTYIKNVYITSHVLL